MKNDDEMVGRILSRREMLKLLGAAGAAALVGCAPGTSGSVQPTGTAAQAAGGLATTVPNTAVPTLAATEAVAEIVGGTAVPSCIVRPAVTEGPYFVDDRIERSDIRSDPASGIVKEGALLALTFNVSDMSNNSCRPLPGAVVDVWHCDALGAYSDVTDRSFDTTGQQFLRGYQITDDNGLARFTTIYPGWYPGRTVHIHFKIRTAPDSQQGYEFTSQLFFDEALSDQVFTQAPYAGKGQQDTSNSRDNIYRDELLLTVAETEQGYAATFNIGLQMT
jgi:protocatechuate 3,4-dioxygenase beta subunit